MSQQNQIEQTKNVLYYSWMSLAITLCPLIPIPFIDFFLEPFLAKQMFSKTNLKKKDIPLFATKNDSFCLGCLWGVFSGIFFFILKPLRIIRLFLRFQTYLKNFQYWLYKCYITDRAMDMFGEHILNDREMMFEFANALDMELRKGELGITMRDNLQQMVVDNGVVKTLRSWWRLLRTLNTESEEDDEILDRESKNLSPINFIQRSIEQDEVKIINFITSWRDRSEV